MARVSGVDVRNGTVDQDQENLSLLRRLMWIQVQAWRENERHIERKRGINDHARRVLEDVLGADVLIAADGEELRQAIVDVTAVWWEK